jgi:hypothetical protein
MIDSGLVALLPSPHFRTGLVFLSFVLSVPTFALEDRLEAFVQCDGDRIFVVSRAVEGSMRNSWSADPEKEFPRRGEAIVSARSLETIGRVLDGLTAPFYDQVVGSRQTVPERASACTVRNPRMATPEARGDS